jgi:hypothetical protein
MDYAVEMDSGAMVYIYCTKFHIDWFSRSKIYGGIHRHTDSMVIAKAYFYFSI